MIAHRTTLPTIRRRIVALVDQAIGEILGDGKRGAAGSR